MMWSRTHKVLVVVAALLLGSLAILNSPYFEKYGIGSQYGSSIRESLPLEYLRGQESRDEYLTKHVMDYPLVQHLNTLPGAKKVLFWWNDPAPGAFYLDGAAAFIFSHFVPKLFTDDPKQIHDILRANGVTHVIVAQPSQEAHLLSNPEGPFVQQYLKKIYQRNAMVLYEVLSEPLNQEIIAYDFLGHIEEALITMPARPSDKPNRDYRAMVGIGEDLRYALVTFPPAEVQYSVTVPERSLLRFAIGRQYPPCASEGSFQVWIKPVKAEKNMIYHRDLKAGNRMLAIGWYEEEIDLASYSSQRVQVIFKSDYLGQGECNWFLWADPVVVIRP